MKSILFAMDDDVYERLVIAKNAEAKRQGKGRLSWKEYFMIVSGTSNGSKLDKYGNLIKR